MEGKREREIEREWRRKRKRQRVIEREREAVPTYELEAAVKLRQLLWFR